MKTRDNEADYAARERAAHEGLAVKTIRQGEIRAEERAAADHDNRVLNEILEERYRQRRTHGHSPRDDDRLVKAELVAMAGRRMRTGTTGRQGLIEAAALLVAEVERLDRLHIKGVI